jgi:hypothetical protein
MQLTLFRENNRCSYETHKYAFWSKRRTFHNFKAGDAYIVVTAVP